MPTILDLLEKELTEAEEKKKAKAHPVQKKKAKAHPVQKNESDKIEPSAPKEAAVPQDTPTDSELVQASITLLHGLAELIENDRLVIEGLGND